MLCSALIDPDGFMKVAGKVKVDSSSFYDRRHELIFAAMERLFNRHAPIDILTVSEELTSNKELESVGGDGYLAGLSNEVATSAHIEEYARIVQDRKTLRSLIATSINVATDAYEVPDAEDLLDRALRELFEIQSLKDSGGFEKINPVLVKALNQLDEQKKREGKLLGVGTGFDRLDDLTSGFQNGELIVIAGRPSMGKTAFSLDIARNACLKYNVGVGYFSLEMAATAIALRLLAAEARLDLHKLRSNNLPDRDLPKLSNAGSKLSVMPFYIDDTGTLGITELHARARMLKQKNDIGIIFIDYLQLMKPPKADNREQEVAQISRALKGLARELGIPVVAMSQLSRAVEHRGADARPQLSDLRDSGAIEQDADVVMFIHREGQYRSGDKENEEKGKDDGSTQVIIRKQRNGPTGVVDLVFHKEYAHFVPKEESEATAMSADVRDTEDSGAPF